MISAPLGDFRHTMHIGRGGDAFGDTSFLSNCGPSNSESSKSNTEESLQSVPLPTLTTADPPEMRLSYEDNASSDGALPKLHHSESVSSFDLDLDLGPSILGDVLGVMDGLRVGCDWTTSKEGEEEVFNPIKISADSGLNELNEVNGIKSKGLRHKVRFSDKKEEIIGRQFGNGGGSEEFQEEREMSPSSTVHRRAEEMASNDVVESINQSIKPNHRADHSPSPSSSMSSEYEGVSPLDRRREEESASEEECVSGEQGYTFEDESDDEIGL